MRSVIPFTGSGLVAIVALTLASGCGDDKPAATDAGSNAAMDAAVDVAPLPPPAKLEITPGKQDFGVAYDCGESAEVTFTVTNVGGQDAPRPEITTTEGFELRKNACASIASLSPGSACTTGVVFRAPQVGDKQGTLTATIPSSTASATLAGSIIANGIVYITTPSAIDFGEVAIDQSSPNQVVMLQNPHPTPFMGVTFEVSDPSFALGSDCKQVLAGCASCRVNVVFTPTRRGPQQAELSFGFGGDKHVAAALSGVGLAPARIEAAPSALAFGEVRLETKSAASNVTVTNTGDEPAVVAFGFDGRSASQFSATSSCAPSLAAGARCTIATVFEPTVLGPAAAELVIDGSPGGTVRVGLAGQGVPRDRVEISPLAGQFGAVPVGTASPTVTFVVSNTGPGPTGELTVERHGVDPKDFAIDVDGCTGVVLAQAATCSVRAHFAPVAPGAKTAALTVTSSAGATATAALMGTALTP